MFSTLRHLVGRAGWARRVPATCEPLEPRRFLDSTPTFDLLSTLDTVDAGGYGLGFGTALKAGDLDGDGRADLVGVGFTAGPQPVNAIRLGVFTNRGGHFESTQTLAFGRVAGDVELGDLDNDGDLDVVISEFGDSFENAPCGFIVLLNNAGTLGTPTFGWVGPIRNAGTSLADIDLADFNRDGILDIVASVNGVSASFVGNGSAVNPQFTPFQQFGGADSFVPADFDGDGITDVAAQLGPAISLFFGSSGDGTLQAGFGFTGPSQTFSLSAGDLTGDGRDDLIATSSLVSSAFFVSQAAVRTQGFVSSEVYSTGPVRSEALIADVDADGFNDAVFRTTVSFVTWHGGPTGTLERRVTSRPGTFGSDEAVSNWVLVNLDADPQPDIVSADSRIQDDLTRLSIHRNIESVLPERRWAGMLDSFEQPIGSREDSAIGDLNGDGIADLVSIGNANTGRVLVQLGGPSAFSQSLTLVTAVPGATLSRVVLADADNDGDRDVFVLAAAARTVYLLANAGGVLGTPRIIYTSNTGAGLSALEVAQMTADTVPDLVLGSTGPNTIRIVTGTLVGGVYSTAAESSFDAAGVPLRIRAADFDGDGSRDLAWLHDTTNRAWIARFVNGVLDNTNVLNTATGAFPFDLSVADVSGDGKPDVTVSTLNLYFSLFNTSGIGLLTFAQQPDVNTGSEGRLVVADVTGDGIADRAWRGAAFLDVRRGGASADGTLERFATLGSSLAKPDAVFLADFTGDHRIDELRFDDNAGNGYSVSRGGPVSPLGWGSTVITPTDSLAFQPPRTADLTGDGRPELITSGPTGLNVWSLENGAVRLLSTAADPSLLRFVATDIDGDSDTDIVWTNELGQVRVSSNPGNGTFTPGPGSLLFDIGFSLRAIAAAPINDDTRPDLLIATTTGIRVFFGLTGGGFAEQPMIATATIGSPVEIALVGLRPGMRPDLVVTSAADARVLRNDGAGSFGVLGAAAIVPGTANASRIDRVELNADFINDLAFGPYQNNTVVTVVNTSNAGTLSFQPAVVTSVGTDVAFFNSYFIGDIDDDRRADLLGLGDGFRLRRGRGDGGFFAGEDFARPAGRSLHAVTVPSDLFGPLQFLLVGPTFVHSVPTLDPESIATPNLSPLVFTSPTYLRGEAFSALTVTTTGPQLNAFVHFYTDNGDGVFTPADPLLSTADNSLGDAPLDGFVATDAPGGLVRVFAVPFTAAGRAGPAVTATYTVIPRTVSVTIVQTQFIGPEFRVTVRYQVDETVNHFDLTSFSSGDVTASGGAFPQGVPGTFISSALNPADRTVTAIYAFPSSRGSWDVSDNGPVLVGLASHQVALSNPSVFLNARPLQMFSFFFEAPVAYAQWQLVSGHELLVGVRYFDNVGISWGSLDDADLELRGPGGMVVPGLLRSRAVSGSAINSHYAFTAPGGTWGSTDNGAYELWVRPTQVWDHLGYAVLSRRLETYNLFFNNPTAERLSESVTDGGSFLDVTVRYSDAVGNAPGIPWGISWGSISDGDLELVGPSGYVELGTLVSRSIPVPGQLVATYRFNARGGVWDHSDNAAYTLRTRLNQVIDNQGYAVPVSDLRTYNLFFAAPTVTVVATDVANGRSDLLVAVTYRGLGATLMSWDSFGDGDDLSLSGPNGYSAVSSLVSRLYDASTNSYTVTYRFLAPGGTWNSADNGQFTLRTRANEVFDALGRPVPAFALTTYGLFF